MHQAFRPGMVYPYHYDQDYASRIGRGEKPAGGSTLGFDALRKALSAEPFEIRTGAWY